MTMSQNKSDYSTLRQLLLCLCPCLRLLNRVYLSSDIINNGCLLISYMWMQQNKTCIVRPSKPMLTINRFTLLLKQTNSLTCEIKRSSIKKCWTFQNKLSAKRLKLNNKHDIYARLSQHDLQMTGALIVKLKFP